MIYALISLYNPTEKNIENIYSISQQVDKIFLCDNSSKNNNYLSNKIQNSKYIFFNENKGLSKAFNFILKDKNNFFLDEDFIIFFDQDSKITDNFITKLIYQYNKVKTYKNIGCIGPVYYNQSNNTVETPRKKIKITESCYSVTNIITSSMLSKYGDLKEIGFWNEDMFLDLADWDICLRFLKVGKICCLTDAVSLTHRLGLGEKKIFFLKLRVGSPFREYYQTRDCLYLLKKNYLPIKIRIRCLEIVTIRAILHLLFLDNFTERFFYIRKGYVDFIKNKHGALN